MQCGDFQTSLQDRGEGKDAASDEADQDLDKELRKAVPYEDGEVGEAFRPGLVQQEFVLLNEETGKLRRLHPPQDISDILGLGAAATDIDAEEGEREGLSRVGVAAAFALEMPVKMLEHLGGLESPKGGGIHHKCGQRLY